MVRQPDEWCASLTCEDGHWPAGTVSGGRRRGAAGATSRVAAWGRGWGLFWLQGVVGFAAAAGVWGVWGFVFGVRGEGRVRLHVQACPPLLHDCPDQPEGQARRVTLPGEHGGPLPGAGLVRTAAGTRHLLLDQAPGGGDFLLGVKGVDGLADLLVLDTVPS